MIFVLEDDTSIRELEIYALEAAGLEAAGFQDAESFLAAARKSPPALAVIDIMLPGGMDGLEAMKRLHEFAPDTCVVVASAKGSEFDRVKGLDLGADDYLAKPFGMLEMTSRVKAVLRRGVRTKESSVAHDDVVLNRTGHSVAVAGEPVELTKKEFALLDIFLSNPDRVFTRENLLERVWGTGGSVETRTVDMHIACLRSKLGRPGILETVRGIGYRLCAGDRS